MKFQRNTRRIIASMLCVLVVAMLLSVNASAAGLCSYRDPSTNVACGKITTRKIVSTSATQHAVHYYENELGPNARCDFYFYYVTEADVCPAGHTTNLYTYRYEYGHGCQYAGR